MFALAWKTLRARKASFAGVFVALLCGSAVMTASGVLAESGLRVSVPAERYAGARLVVGADRTLRIPGGDFTVAEPLPEHRPLAARTVHDVAAVPGVRTAVGDYDVEVAVTPVTDRSGAARTTPSSGHAWDSAALAPLRLTDGHPPRSRDEIVVESALARAAGLRTGDEVRVTRASVPAVYRVSGIAASPAGDAWKRTLAVYFTPAEAARLSGHPGRPDAVGVVSDRGTDTAALAAAVQRAAGSGTVTHGGDDAARIEFPDVGASRDLLFLVAASFGGTAVLIAVFVVAGTLALSVGRRRREFAVLRAIGSTPSQIYRMVVAESVLVALIGGVLGCLPGVRLAEAMRGLFARFGAVPEDLPIVIGPAPLAGAVLLTVLTAVVAALAAARRPARLNPVDALGEAAVEPATLPGWRRTLGLLCLVCGAGAAMSPLYVRSEVGAAGTGSAALLCVVGLALLGPAVVRVWVAVTAPLLRRLPVSGFLVVANTNAGLRRAGSAAMPLVLAIGFTLTMVYTQTTLAAASERQVDQGLTADLLLADNGSGGIAPAVADEVRRTPGVAAAVTVTDTKVFVPFTVFEDKDLAGFSARAVGTDGLTRTMDPGVVDGSLKDLRGPGTVAVEHSQAELLGTGVGDRLDVRLGDGAPARLRIVATYERGLGFGDMTLPQEAVAGHTTEAPGRLLVRAEEGRDPADVAAALRSLAAEHPSLSLLDRKQFADGARAESVLNAWINFTGLAVILGYLAVSVVNTLVVATSARSREFALMRLVGATRRQVMRTLRLEAGLVCALAVALGSLVAAVPLGALGTGFLGSPVPAGTPAVYLAVVAVAVLLGLGSVAVPVRLALRIAPVEAIGVRE
ncbi:FtsX-like permease family protein [Streptomyces meridianus]|uniref:FtsX-like permease family protein n=1 Tax=Streptomyces meridianus TaxID=2938945 RepID=A0ABT0X638_9ACTN|nr:ABC transporter permease [Streptomyces meridianus]MCM2578002.1 FtsX-like permease family protein [Streptomyces meridianus]